MKQLITLSILLLAGPSLANAQQTLEVTSGSGGLQPLAIGPEPIANASFNTAGTDFSFSGAITISFENPFQFGPYTPGPPPSQTGYEGDTSVSQNLLVSLTVQGVPFAYNSQDLISGAQVLFSLGPFEFSGPGTFYSPFEMGGSFTGAPANVLAANPAVCAQMLPACSTFGIQGSGIVTYNVVPDMFDPGALFINSLGLTFTAPEPSTAPLLLLGLAGLEALSCRRRFIAHSSCASVVHLDSR